MPEVFISYARAAEHEDHLIAKALRDRLVSMGVDAFWDRDIQPGQHFATVLNEKAAQAKVVISLWSAHSLGQEWILSECRLAKNDRKLFPLLLAEDKSCIPVEFNGVQVLPFDDQSEQCWRELMIGLGNQLARPDLLSRFELSIRPLIAESTTAEAMSVKVVLDLMERSRVVIPDYQRDGNEWDPKTRSEFIESIINNLAIPAFFFEPSIKDGREINYVVDGQQRLNTLRDFATNRFALLPSDSAEYISPSNIYYAGKLYRDLPEQFRDAFESYRLTIINLRSLGDMRLEVFRRINSGGEPLSDQDIRLAYYGSDSATVTFIRLAGIYDVTRGSSERFLAAAASSFKIDFPWQDKRSAEAWKKWWDGKATSAGQAASELFLLALVAAQFKNVNKLVSDTDLLSALKISQSRTLSHVLSIYCARSAFEDRNVPQTPGERRMLYSLQELQKGFFPYFQDCFTRFQQRDLSMIHSKQMAVVIGVMYRNRVKPDQISANDLLWKLARSPRQVIEATGKKWPAGKGIWSGKAGHNAQLRELNTYIRSVYKMQAEVD